jgi:hypothetical protein
MATRYYVFPLYRLDIEDFLVFRDFFDGAAPVHGGVTHGA